MSLLEVVSAYFIDEKGWSRRRTSWILGGVIFVCGIPSSMSEDFLGIMDRLATNYLLPGGALLIAVFTGWVLSYSERKAEFEAVEVTRFAFLTWSVLLCFVSPIAVVLIFLHQLGLF
jgi:NSS family neurotransmitter:Na+ symporter